MAIFGHPYFNLISDNNELKQIFSFFDLLFFLWNLVYLTKTNRLYSSVQAQSGVVTNYFCYISKSNFLDKVKRLFSLNIVGL